MFSYLNRSSALNWADFDEEFSYEGRWTYLFTSLSRMWCMDTRIWFEVRLSQSFLIIEYYDSCLFKRAVLSSSFKFVAEDGDMRSM
jgi:hypothetical protein